MNNFFLVAVTQRGDHSDPTTILGVRFNMDTGLDVTVEALRSTLNVRCVASAIATQWA